MNHGKSQEIFTKCLRNHSESTEHLALLEADLSQQLQRMDARMGGAEELMLSDEMSEITRRSEWLIMVNHG